MLSICYKKHFGIYPVGSDKLCEQQGGDTVFTHFKHDNKYFPAEQQFMINFHVTDIDKLLERLKAEAVKIDDQKMHESFRKFAWV